MPLPETEDRFHAVHRATDGIRDRLPGHFNRFGCAEGSARSHDCAHHQTNRRPCSWDDRPDRCTSCHIRGKSSSRRARVEPECSSDTLPRDGLWHRVPVVDIGHDGRYRAGRTNHPADTENPFSSKPPIFGSSNHRNNPGSALPGPVPGTRRSTWSSPRAHRRPCRRRSRPQSRSAPRPSSGPGRVPAGLVGRCRAGSCRGRCEVVSVRVQGPHCVLKRVGVTVAGRLQLAQRRFGVADGVVFAAADKRIQRVSVFRGECGIFFQLHRLADEAVQLLQLTF